MDWFRLYAEFASDPKVQMMDEAMQRRLVMLFCLQCGNGYAPMTDHEVSVALCIGSDDVAQTKRMLMQKGFVNSDWQLETELETGRNRPPASVWAEIRDRIFKRDNYVCQYCGTRGGKMECDHIIPVSRGGDHTDSNLAAACFACNRSKRAKLLSEWRPA